MSSFQRESPIPDAIATWTLAFVRPTGPILYPVVLPQSVSQIFLSSSSDFARSYPFVLRFFCDQSEISSPRAFYLRIFATSAKGRGQVGRMRAVRIISTFFQTQRQSEGWFVATGVMFLANPFSTGQSLAVLVRGRRLLADTRFLLTDTTRSAPAARRDPNHQPPPTERVGHFNASR